MGMYMLEELVERFREVKNVFVFYVCGDSVGLGLPRRVCTRSDLT